MVYKIPPGGGGRGSIASSRPIRNGKSHLPHKVSPFECYYFITHVHIVRNGSKYIYWCEARSHFLPIKGVWTWGHFTVNFLRTTVMLSHISYAQEIERNNKLKIWENKIKMRKGSYFEILHRRNPLVDEPAWEHGYMAPCALHRECTKVKKLLSWPSSMKIRCVIIIKYEWLLFAE